MEQITISKDSWHYKFIKFAKVSDFWRLTDSCKYIRGLILSFIGLLFYITCVLVASYGIACTVIKYAILSYYSSISPFNILKLLDIIGVYTIYDGRHSENFISGVLLWSEFIGILCIGLALLFAVIALIIAIHIAVENYLDKRRYAKYSGTPISENPLVAMVKAKANKYCLKINFE